MDEKDDDWCRQNSLKSELVMQVCFMFRFVLFVFVFVFVFDPFSSLFPSRYLFY